jgi:hypothetical protein
MKIAINKCYGGFCLSDDAEALVRSKYKALTGKGEVWSYTLERNDPILIEVIEELGETANGSYAELKIVEIPDDINWVIQEYDGIEWVAEVHQTWE